MTGVGFAPEVSTEALEVLSTRILELRREGHLYTWRTVRERVIELAEG